MTDSMAGRWFVTAHNPDGEQHTGLVDLSTGVDDPWENADSWDWHSESPGYWQQAERFVPAYHGHTFYGPNGDPDSYSLKDPFVREVRVRTKTECLYGENHDSELGITADVCTICDGRGWYWKEETNGS